MHGKSLQVCLTLCDPWTVAQQAALSMEFSRQEYLSGLPFPSPGDLPDPGIKPGSPASQAGSLLTELHGRSEGWWVGPKRGQTWGVCRARKVFEPGLDLTLLPRPPAAGQGGRDGR